MNSDKAETVTVQKQFEANPEAFALMTKAVFDRLARDHKFAEGPYRETFGDWYEQYGPYVPHRWAFGRLKDGRLVKADVA